MRAGLADDSGKVQHVVECVAEKEEGGKARDRQVRIADREMMGYERMRERNGQ
ncbi:hypothetical protein ZHAS_00005714 [Anopheles sinensis]|uniref:Uncharacterized protein n=1 Tax=Anopheles sinensis TaxID=74873 RepID=A0A084VK65_ANOSI|nr:hypothetical protein ZHAS_00005714 [Anopheles sinensis]